MPYIDNISVAGQTYELKDTTGTFIAPQEVSPAEAAHAVGEYLVYNGTLYQVSAAISVGDALTAGTNITAVPGEIGGEVTELKSQIIAENYTNIELGTIDGTSGQDTASTTRCRTVGYIPINDFWYCNLRDTIYGLMILYYSASKTYLGRNDTNFHDGEFINRDSPSAYSDAVYIRLTFRRQGNAAMPAADCEALSKLIRVFNANSSAVINGEAAAQSEAYTELAKISSGYYSTNFIDLELGSIGGSDGQDSAGTRRCRTKGYIAIDKFLCANTLGTAYKMIPFCYDSQYSYIGRTVGGFDAENITRFSVISSIPETAYIRLAFARTDGAVMSDTDIVALRTMIYVSADARKLDGDKARFDRQFNYVAYSMLSSNDAPINSEEHFINCANAGTFTALKGDVRNTADGGLIMCHDAGYTFDSNGKITTYNRSNNTPIDTLTVAQCKALTFADQWDGKDVHPCDFETFVRVCKKHGLIAFVTVRDQHIADVVAPEVLRILTLYRMLDHAIVNSFTKATLEIFRALNQSITLSLVLDNKVIPTNADVDYVVSLGNCNLNLFDMPVDSSIPGTNVEDKLENLLSGAEYTAVLDYAHSKNVVLYDAQCGNAAPDVLLRHGIVGAHMYTVPDYDWKRS